MTPVNGVITLEKNYIVTGAWSSLDSLGNSVVIEGNGHTISGLNKPLIAGNAAPSITIKDLTISSSFIGVADRENVLETGAFVSYMDAGTVAKFTNCHLVNSSVTGNERAAGIASYSSGTTLTIENCSVENC